MPTRTLKSASAPATDDDGQRAFAIARTTLGESVEGVTLTLGTDRAELAFRGIHYATIERTGRSVLASFLVQEGDAEATARRTGYEAEPNRPNWVRIRLGKEARRWQEAGVAALVSHTLAVLRSMSNVGRWKFLLPKDGPFVVGPASSITVWNEDPRARTTTAHRGATETATVVEWRGGHALVLAACGPLYFQSRDDGGVFVLVESAIPVLEHELRSHVAEAPIADDSAVAGSLDVRESLVARAVGHVASQDEVLACALPTGRYAVETQRSTPSESLTLHLVHLRRT